MKKSVALFAPALAGVYFGIKRPLGALGVASVMATTPVYAMSESLVHNFAHAMKISANAQNIGQLSRLIDDNAVISITRQGRSTTLDKNAYLQLLQKSWAGSKDYRYDIIISDVVVSGSQAKAQVRTTESWLKDGKKITINTVSRATLQDNGKNAVLLRAVSQLTIE